MASKLLRTGLAPDFSVISEFGIPFLVLKTDRRGSFSTASKRGRSHQGRNLMLAIERGGNGHETEGAGVSFDALTGTDSEVLSYTSGWCYPSNALERFVLLLATIKT
jgi:hypothetical protein